MNSSIKQGLVSISSNPEELNKFLDIFKKDISLPNIPFWTMGGEVFWTTLCEANGWRVQQNMFTRHARILRDDNVRIAWGTVNGMIMAFERFARLQNTYGK